MLLYILIFTKNILIFTKNILIFTKCFAFFIFSILILLYFLCHAILISSQY